MALDLGPLGQQTILSTSLIAVGAISLSFVLFMVTRVLLSTFILPGKSLSSFGPKGSWAVITGASDGIGKEFSLQLSRKGFNVLLVSRTQSKLDALSSQITSSNENAVVETHSMDFSQNQSRDYESLAQKLSGKRVAVLINNVGQSHSIPVPFAETDLTELTNIININCLATLRVTQTVLPHMLPQKKGLVLTMGSFGGLCPTPFLATYSGSKAFLQQWSNALASELSPNGITVHFVHSWMVTTAMSKIRRSSMQVPTEKTFVKATLGRIGNQGGSVGYTYSGTPYWYHAIVASLMTGVLGVYSPLLLWINRDMHVQIRKRALAKAQRDKAKGKKEL